MLFKVLAAASLAALMLPAAASAKWREASTRHFVIYSEEKEEALRKFAERLERYDGAMRHLRALPNENLGPANRLTVYVVPNRGAVQKLAGDKGGFLAGFYIPRASGSVAFVPRRAGDGGKWDMDPEGVLLHEYAHHFLFQNFPGAYPLWFAEGFAEFHAATKFDKSGAVEVGHPALHRAYGLLSGNPLPLEKMVALGTEKLSREQREAIYGRGWLLTHYLTFEKSRHGQLSNYLKGLNSGKNGLEAATAAFGDLKVLEKELDAYLKQRRMSFVEVSPLAFDPGPIDIREVSPGEDAVMEAKIRSRRGVNLEQAKALLPELRRRATPYPDDPAVQATLAEAEYDARNYKEAEAAADRALAADPKRVDALIYKGRAAMALARGSDDAKIWRDVRHSFIAANKVDALDPEPLILFYRSFREQGVKPTANAVAALVKAYELAPQDLGLRMNVARQFLADGKVKEAREALAPVAFTPHEGPISAVAQAVLKALDSGTADNGLKAFSGGDEEEGSGAS